MSDGSSTSTSTSNSDFFDTVLQRYIEDSSANHIPVNEYNVLREFKPNEPIVGKLPQHEFEIASNAPLGIEGKRAILLHEVMSAVLSGAVFTDAELLRSLDRFLHHHKMANLGGLQLLEILKVFDEAHRYEIVQHLLMYPGIFDKIMRTLCIYISDVEHKGYCETQLEYLISSLSHLDREVQKYVLSTYFGAYIPRSIVEQAVKEHKWVMALLHEAKNNGKLQADVDKRVKIILDLLAKVNKNINRPALQKQCIKIITDQLIIKDTYSIALTAGTDLTELEKTAARTGAK